MKIDFPSKALTGRSATRLNPGWAGDQAPEELRPSALPRYLQHRLTVFALGCGAQSVAFEDCGNGTPVLTATPRSGEAVRLELRGCAREWHAALDRFEAECEEPSEEGLYRFLGTRKAA